MKKYIILSLSLVLCGSVVFSQPVKVQLNEQTERIGATDKVFPLGWCEKNENILIVDKDALGRNTNYIIKNNCSTGEITKREFESENKIEKFLGSVSDKDGFYFVYYGRKKKNDATNIIGVKMDPDGKVEEMKSVDMPGEWSKDPPDQKYFKTGEEMTVSVVFRKSDDNNYYLLSGEKNLLLGKVSGEVIYRIKSENHLDDIVSNDGSVYSLVVGEAGLVLNKLNARGNIEKKARLPIKRGITNIRMELSMDQKFILVAMLTTDDKYEEKIVAESSHAIANNLSLMVFETSELNEKVIDELKLDNKQDYYFIDDMAWSESGTYISLARKYIKVEGEWGDPVNKIESVGEDLILAYVGNNGKSISKPIEWKFKKTQYHYDDWVLNTGFISHNAKIYLYYFGKKLTVQGKYPLNFVEMNSRLDFSTSYIYEPRQERFLFDPARLKKNPGASSYLAAGFQEKMNLSLQTGMVDLNF